MMKEMIKGSINMPTEIMIGIVIAVLILLAGLWMFGFIPNVMGGQAYQGAFNACCVSYNLAGLCQEGASNYNFECTVGTDIASSGKIKISELSAKAGMTVERCCNR